MTTYRFELFLKREGVYYDFLEALRLNSINVSINHICELKENLWISESVDLDNDEWRKLNEKYLLFLESLNEHYMSSY